MNQIFRAFSDPTRRKVLELLRKRPMTAGEIAVHFVVSKPTMSAHFAVLRAADLIEQEKVGREIIYRLKMSVLEEALLSFVQAFGFELLPRARRGAHKGKARKGEIST
jgi:DNA-binding transcriptional ArsR family regulator